MDTRSERDINLGVGFATLADSFQSGREAAQMAKRELRSPARVNFVAALAPSNIQFAKYLEGVRLVSGGDGMIGIPTGKFVMNDLLPPDSGIVLALQTKTTQISIASSIFSDENQWPSITSLLTQFRQSRGNIRHQFEHHGVIAFTSSDQPDLYNTMVSLSDDAGLDSWLLGLTLTSQTQVPILCRDEAISKGIVALEILSNSTWGLSTVSTAAFPQEPKTIQEAAKTALREALGQMGADEPLVAAIFIGGDSFPFSSSDLNHLLLSGSHQPAKFPIFVFNCSDCVVRPSNRTIAHGKEVVAALVVPQ